MKKIIWISSYPKSGNTWMRHLLCNYFYNDHKSDLKFDILKNIKKFPNTQRVNKLANKKEVLNNPYNISKYWLQMQEEIIRTNKKFIFLKNHNALVSLDNNELTNELFSLGAIYIVRDPRDVLISYLNFNKKLTLKNGLEQLTSKDLYCHVSKKNPLDIEILGSWKFNYISWRDGIQKIPRIIIKYEDLVNDTYNILLKVIIFLSKLINCKIDHEKINFSIEQSSFERLQKLEKVIGFKESSSTNKFFNSGKINQWQNYLSVSQVDLIKKKFKKEMEELNYIRKD